jgi:hypothetical protein
VTGSRSGDVFVSFSREDREYVDRLLEAFDERNIKYWLDEQTGTAGRSVRVITRKLEAAIAVVVVMTPDAKQSRWVETELQYALDLPRPVVPLLLRGTAIESFATSKPRCVKPRCDTLDTAGSPPVCGSVTRMVNDPRRCGLAEPAVP